MTKDTLNEQVGILTRREIEARILKPFYEAVKTELGEEKAKELLKTIVINEAKAVGKAMLEKTQAETVTSFADQWEPWFRGGALEIDVLEQTESTWRFNVKRCKYAEMYRALGMADLGTTLSCNRDAALIEGYSDKIEFKRTQTLMQGASCCDFSYSQKADVS